MSGWPVVYIEGPLYLTSSNDVFFSLKIDIVLANSEDQDDMLYNAEIHLGLHCLSKVQNEPRHEIPNNVVCATSRASDQPAHTRSLIRVFASRLNIL